VTPKSLLPLEQRGKIPPSFFLPYPFLFSWRKS
jgi:hypothetical protein